MKKPHRSDRYLSDWNTPITDEWIQTAKAFQTAHCRNIGANEKGICFKQDLFHKIDDLILMHAFGMVKSVLWNR